MHEKVLHEKVILLGLWLSLKTLFKEIYFILPWYKMDLSLVTRNKEQM